MDFELKVATVDNEQPISRWCGINYALILVSDSVALLYRDDDGAYTDDNMNASDAVTTAGWSPTQLSTLFRNLINKQDSEGRLWYGGSLEHDPVAPFAPMAVQLGSSDNLNTDASESAGTGAPIPTYTTEQYNVDAGFETFGPRIIVPLREEHLMDRTMIVDGNANARAEYTARHRVKVMGGFGAHGGIALLGAWREDISTGSVETDRFLLDSNHSATSFALSVGWSDQMRTQEIAKNSGTAAGAWFRQLWAGDNYVENNNIFTDDKVNIGVKGRIYVDTPYTIVGS